LGIRPLLRGKQPSTDIAVEVGCRCQAGFLPLIGSAGKFDGEGRLLDSPCVRSWAVNLIIRTSALGRQPPKTALHSGRSTAKSSGAAFKAVQSSLCRARWRRPGASNGRS